MTAPERSADAEPGLAIAQERWNLSRFERDVLALLLAAELGHERGRWPTVGDVVVDLTPGGERDGLALLAADAHLVRTALVELVGDGPHASRELRLARGLWPRLLGLPTTLPVRVSRSEQLSGLALADGVRARASAAIAWAAARRCSDVLIAIVGPPGSGRDALAAAIAGELGFAVIEVEGARVSDESFGVLAREAAWLRAAVVVRGPVERAALERVCAEISTPVIAILEADAVRATAVFAPRQVCEVAIPPWSSRERAACWARRLRGVACADDVDLEALARRGRLGPTRIAAAVALATASADGRPLGHADLERACRLPDDGRSPGLARVVESDVGLDDVVVGRAIRRELDLILAWARHGRAVFGRDGAGRRARLGDGLVCLFSGPPGTGKTMSARALGHELATDVLSVDLADITSKYIGETEKNLERVFVEAELRGALLFFDEADALFGRRTEIKDSHDRYANLEVSFLLQRLETHAGIVMLATNRRDNLDSAFLRRIHVIVDFELPEVAERELIWRRHLVAEHLAPGVDLPHLAARFALSGAEIRNAAATAALLAAVDRTCTTMRHLMLSVWRELRKAGRVVGADQFGAFRDDIVEYQRAEIRSPPVV